MENTAKGVLGDGGDWSKVCDSGWFSLELRLQCELTMVVLRHCFLLIRWWHNLLFLDVGLGGPGEARSGAVMVEGRRLGLWLKNKHLGATSGSFYGPRDRRGAGDIPLTEDHVEMR
jgi:hypothetical protein